LNLNGGIYEYADLTRAVYTLK